MKQGARSPDTDLDAPLVLVLGPSPTMTGGMAAVVGQHVDTSFGPRYRTALFPITTSPRSSEWFPGKVYRHLRHWQALKRVIRRSRPWIVHIHTCSGVSFFRSLIDMKTARRMGCLAVLHIHGAAFDKFYEDAGPLRRRWIRNGLTDADAVITLSQNWRNKILKMAPAARAVVIENAVAGPPQVPARRRRGTCRFLLLARMDVWKGVDDLLDACAILRAEGCSFELTMAGPDGTAGDAGRLRQKICERDLTACVHYVGPVYGEAKAKLMHWADVYVSPSHCEGMPLSILEALASGLPVVGTRVGAVAEVVTPGVHGLLVSPHRPDELARALQRLAADPALRRLMSEAAIDLASTRFAISRLRDDLGNLYDALQAAPRRASRAAIGPQLTATTAQSRLGDLAKP